MRDLNTEELGFVYGAGGASRCKPPKNKCKGSHSKGSRSKCSKSKKSKSKKSRSKC